MIQNIPSKDSEEYLIFHPAVDPQYKVENLCIVSSSDLFAVAWHKGRSERVLLSVRVRATKWEIREVASLGCHGPCIDVLHDEDISETRLVFYNGVILHLDRDGAEKHVHRIGHCITVYDHCGVDVMMVGDGSGRVSVLEYGRDDHRLPIERKAEA